MKPVIHLKGRSRQARAFHVRRYRVDCFAHELKRFWAIATRYDETARNYLALVLLVRAGRLAAN